MWADILPRGSNVVPFWVMTVLNYFLDILAKKGATFEPLGKDPI